MNETFRSFVLFISWFYVCLGNNYKPKCIQGAIAEHYFN